MSSLEVINIENREGQLVVTSRQIAEHFEKEHKHIMESILEISRDMGRTTTHKRWIKELYLNSLRVLY